MGTVICSYYNFFNLSLVEMPFIYSTPVSGLLWSGKHVSGVWRTEFVVCEWLGSEGGPSGHILKPTFLHVSQILLPSPPLAG